MRPAAARLGVFLLLAQAGCAAPPQPAPAPPDQAVSPFNQALHQNYLELAGRRGGDPLTWAKFGSKAEAAAQGGVVMPSGPDPLLVGNVRTVALRNARKQLLAAMEEGGRLRVPEPLALAQTRFDCWVEWVRTGSKPEDPLAACREEFEQAMAQLGP